MELGECQCIIQGNQALSAEVGVAHDVIVM